MSTIKLIVGLGNPGPKHAQDRHNAGYWFVEALARTGAPGGGFAGERKFHGEVCQATVAGHGVRLLKPTTFMNRSGQSVRAMVDFYRLAPEEVLVAHDELDLPPGTARLKRGGGHGGHNGLRDLIAHIGRDFMRLRLGIGHPGSREQVVGFVLKAPTREEAARIDDAMREAVSAVEVLLRDGEQKAMSQLHSRANAPAPEKPPGGGAASEKSGGPAESGVQASEKRGGPARSGAGASEKSGGSAKPGRSDAGAANKTGNEAN